MDDCMFLINKVKEEVKLLKQKGDKDVDLKQKAG